MGRYFRLELDDYSTPSFVSAGKYYFGTLEDIDNELKALSENGYSEIVFVGINLSDYGKNTPYSLPDALRLAEKYDGIKRVRLGSLEPDHLTVLNLTVREYVAGILIACLRESFACEVASMVEAGFAWSINPLAKFSVAL